MNVRTVIGREIDAIARGRLRNFLDRVGIAEPSSDILVNRWLRDPSGSGKYRIPDVNLPNSQRILEGTIAEKTSSTPQVVDIRDYSGGSRVDIIKPIHPAFRRR